MGSCLEIISDHNLEFKSGQKTLCEFSNRIRWGNLMSYIPKLVKAIGGKNLIFFEDDRFQDTTDLCYQGKNINEISSAMKSQWEPTKLEEIVKLKNIHKVKYGWYYQTIKDDI
ncbi:MAG: hypothetical protein IPO92_00010 [Saprospiraceae bacterium]|nr:hypothetical protein [Saprospiraceae bacterium]